MKELSVDAPNQHRYPIHNDNIFSEIPLRSTPNRVSRRTIRRAEDSSLWSVHRVDRDHQSHRLECSRLASTRHQFVVNVEESKALQAPVAEKTTQ